MTNKRTNHSNGNGNSNGKGNSNGHSKGKATADPYEALLQLRFDGSCGQESASLRDPRLRNLHLTFKARVIELQTLLDVRYA